MAKEKPNFLKRLPRNAFLVLFILSSLLAAFSLRHNNLTMIKLRSAVFSADEKNGDVNTALNNLREYVYGHMNTNLSSGGNTIKPPIQLQHTYERLQNEATQKTNNSDLYTEAQIYCQKKYPLTAGYYGGVRVPCISDYVISHGGELAPKVPVALYQFDFVSPTWSPDLAGWSLLTSVIFLTAYIARAISDRRQSRLA